MSGELRKTLVVGASVKPERYSYKAIEMLTGKDFPTLAYGLREAEVLGVHIKKDWESFEDIDTVTLYVNPKRQEDIIPEILKLKPRRIIFNPGTENSDFYKLAKENNIDILEACTLVMISTGQYF